MKRKTKLLHLLLVFCMAFYLTGCVGRMKSCSISPSTNASSSSDVGGDSSTDNSSNDNSSNGDSSGGDEPFVPTEEPTVEVPIRDLAMEKLFTVNDGATIMSASVGTGEREHKGVLLTPKTATTEYEGSFNGVFDGSLKLTFSFPGTCDRKVEDMPNGNFIFRMTDVADQDNWVEVEYYVATKNWYMGAVVRDSKGNQRTTQYYSSHIYTYKTMESEAAWYGYFGQDDVASTNLELRWGADVLSVLTSNPMKGKGDDEMKLIAKFDGTTEVDDMESRFGVEKVAFPQGYTLSFRSNCYLDNVTTIRLENIVETDRNTLLEEEISLESATVDYTPEWYEKYNNDYSKMTVAGTYEAQYLQGETVQIFDASYSYPAMADFEEKPVEQIEWKKPNASAYEKITATEMTLDQAGIYTIRYTAVRESTRAGNVVTKQFEVLGGTFNTENLVTITSGDATVTSGAQGEGSKNRSGILISPSTETTAFEGTLNGAFTGNLKIKLAFPGKLGTDGYSLDGEVEFRIQDVTNEANYFDIIFYNGRRDWGNAICIRDNKGNYRTVSPSGTWADTKSHVGLAGYFGQDDRESSTFSLNWSLDFLSVKATDASGGNERTIARFDGTAEYSPEDNAYGLEKMAFPSGYKISFKSLCSGNRVSPIILEEIGDADLGNKVLEEDPSWYSAYLAQIKITVNGTYDNLYASGDEIDIHDATYCYPKQEDAEDAPVSKIEVNINGSGFQKIDAGKLTLQSGTYVIRYTAVSGMSNVGNTYEVSFQVSNNLFDLANVISISEGGATKTAGTSIVGEAGVHEGVLVQPSSATTEYSGKINGVFTGDSKIVFSSPSVPKSGISADGYVEFTIADKDDPTNYFKIVYRNHNRQNGTKIYLVDKHGQIRCSYTIYIAHQTDCTDNLYSTGFGFSKDQPSNQFELKWEDGVLSVWAVGRGNGGVSINRLLAKFDGTYDSAAANNGFVSGNATTTVWGLETFNPVNGYTISFRSAIGEAIPYMVVDTEVTPILFESINDVSLAPIRQVGAPEWYWEETEN